MELLQPPVRSQGTQDTGASVAADRHPRGGGRGPGAGQPGGHRRDPAPGRGGKASDDDGPPRPMAPFPKMVPDLAQPGGPGLHGQAGHPRPCLGVPGPDVRTPDARLQADFRKGGPTMGGRRIIFPMSLGEGGGRGFMGRSVAKDPVEKWRPISATERLFYDPLGMLAGHRVHPLVFLVEWRDLTWRPASGELPAGGLQPGVVGDRMEGRPTPAVRPDRPAVRRGSRGLEGARRPLAQARGGPPGAAPGSA